MDRRVIIAIAQQTTAFLLRKRPAKSTEGQVLAIALAGLLALASLPAAAGERLSEADIVKALAGVTLDGIYFDGTYFTETYHDDGTVRYWDAVSADSGEWSVKDGQFCTFYENQQGACFTVERDGNNCFTFYEKDDKTGAIDPADWTSRGWNRAFPATCPVPPEVKL
jgi:hypothetical protein